MSSEDLKAKRLQLAENDEIILDNLQALADESLRVANVAHSSREILEELDNEFEKQTGLQKADFAFLFFATALQITRIALMNSLTKIERAGQGKLEKDLKDKQTEIFDKVEADKNESATYYYAPLSQIISTTGVPYDVMEYVNKNNLGLFKGANHRFATVGHDPVLGLVFGTANILTNTITCVDKSLIGIGGKKYVPNIPIGKPLITTNHVFYTEQVMKKGIKFKSPKIGEDASTVRMLDKAVSRVDDDMQSVIAAVIKQIIHIGTDMFTPCGIQLPAANIVLSNNLVEDMTKYISMGDVLKTGASAGIAALINLIIGCLHRLTYDESKCESKEIFNVRTRKLLTISNVIATSSNVIWVGTNVATGDKTKIKDLDIGGLLIIIHRLIHDEEYIRKVKEEFIFGKFNSLIQGKELELKELHR